MICPKCGAPTGINESRNVPQIHGHRRRHHCPNCGYRFTTYEFIVEDPLCVELDKMDTPRGPVSGYFVLLPFTRTLKAALARQRRARERMAQPRKQG